MFHNLVLTYWILFACTDYFTWWFVGRYFALCRNPVSLRGYRSNIFEWVRTEVQDSRVQIYSDGSRVLHVSQLVPKFLVLKLMNDYNSMEYLLYRLFYSEFCWFLSIAINALYVSIFQNFSNSSFWIIRINVIHK